MKIKEIGFKFGYGVDIELNFNDMYKMDLKEIETKINECGKLKIRIFQEFFYLSFTDKTQQDDLKQRVQDGLIKRAIRTKQH